MEKEVFGSSTFKEFADKKLVLVEADFPAGKKQSAELKKANERLKKQFKIEGYPTIVLLDPEGKKLGEEVGYGGGGPEAYIKSLEAILQKASK